LNRVQTSTFRDWSKTPYTGSRLPISVSFSNSNTR
jgi:hypothetical protein